MNWACFSTVDMYQCISILKKLLAGSAKLSDPAWRWALRTVEKAVRSNCKKGQEGALSDKIVGDRMTYLDIAWHIWMISHYWHYMTLWHYIKNSEWHILTLWHYMIIWVIGIVSDVFCFSFPRSQAGAAQLEERFQDANLHIVQVGATFSSLCTDGYRPLKSFQIFLSMTVSLSGMPFLYFQWSSPLFHWHWTA